MSVQHPVVEDVGSEDSIMEKRWLMKDAFIDL